MVPRFVIINPPQNEFVGLACGAMKGSSHAALEEEAQMRVLRDRYASLTRREREVMALVVSGLLNKQVAGELDISEITVKAHRGNVTRRER